MPNKKKPRQKSPEPAHIQNLGQAKQVISGSKFQTTAQNSEQVKHFKSSCVEML